MSYILNPKFSSMQGFTGTYKYCCILISCLSFMLSACSQKNFSQLPAYQFKSVTGAPDYGDLHYWAAHPWKHDPGDSVPKPLRATFVKDSTVDVFFIYPTSLTDPDNPAMNARIDDAELNANTDYRAILYQASVFNEHARVFAPRYRQAHLRAFTTATKPVADSAFALAYSDVKNAFEYYLQHYNNGRPIIIASHSQGTLHAAKLLSDFFDGKPLQRKLVCAYIIGLPVRTDYFKHLQACNNANATGCIVSWRTYEKGYEGEAYLGRENFKAININPLTFKNDTTYAPPSLNKGGMLKDFNKLIPGLVDAQVHKNILWASKPRFFGSVFLKIKNYHIADYNFFYSNIRQNAGRRIGMFWKQ